MAKVSPKLGAAMVVLGLSALSPVHAIDQGQILILGNGKGKATGPIMVKPARGDQTRGVVVVHGDSNGEVRLTGLAPGNYTVQVFEAEQAVPMRVGRDGRLAFGAYAEIKQADPAEAEPRARRALPVVRRWAEPIAFGEEGGSGTIIAIVAARGPMPDNAVVLDLRQAFTISPPVPCARPRPGMPSTCGSRFRNFIDVNASPAEEMRRLAPTLSAEAAAFIVAERNPFKPYKDAQDFASRVCTKISIDFDDVPLKLGLTSIVMKRGGEPKANGFKCAPRDGIVQLFDSRLSYVGHVTLLR